MKKIASIILAILCLTSCGVAKINPELEQKYISGEVFQTLSKFEALVMTNKYDVVKIMTTKETLYDGKKLYGWYVMIDTYQYTTTRGVTKTVPVYVKRQEFLDP